MTDTMISRTADFLNTLGVQTHLEYLDGGYAQIGTVAAELKRLGVRHIRDGISDGPNGAAPLSSYIALARQGFTFTILAPDASVVDTASLNARLALIQRLVEAVPGSVTSIEGANEINNWPVTFNGVGGLNGAIAMQKALYAAVHGNPAFAGIAVDYFTGYAAGSIGVGPDPSTTPGLADADTQHPYPNFGQAPGFWVDPATAAGNEPGQKGRLVYTETGYSSNGGTAGGVDQSVQARYTLDLLFDAMKNGVAETDLYELMDAYRTGSPQGNSGYGLFNLDGTAKPVAAAIGNLTTILADTGSNAATFQTSAFAPTVTGLPATGRTLVLQKSSGVTDVVVWAEPKIWDQATGTEVAAPAQTVTVDLGGMHQSVAIFDPLTGSVPIQTLTNVRSARIVLTDHPLIVEVGPATPPPTVAITGQVLAHDTGASSSDNITTDGAVTLSGTVSGSPGTVVTVFDGATALGPASPAGAGGWTFATTLGAGVHALRAVATDQAGTTVTSATASALTVLATPPTIALATETVGSDGKTVTVAGTVSGASGTVVTLADGTVPLGTATLDGHGGWQLTTALAPGRHALIATATDLAGNTASVDPPLTVPDPAPARNPGLLVLQVCEDAFDGDAQFTVSVDGQQVGGVQTATALHRAYQWQSVALTGYFGDGPHTVGVNFLNDAYGGAPTKDRNLFVKTITLDGTTTVVNSSQTYGGLKTYGLCSPAAPVQAPAPATAALSIAAGVTLILDKAAASGAAVTFAGAGAVAQFTDAASFHGSLAGFGSSDVMDLRSVGFSGALGLAYAGNGQAGTLTVSDGMHVASLAMRGSYATANFLAASDHLGGTAITFRA